jgi:predicted outer membrane repeat protein
MNINACVIMGNVGGGVLVTGPLNVTNSTFRQNANYGPGEQSGAGIYNYGGTITVTNSTFFQNHSSANGGAIYNDDGVATITGSVFYENGAGSFGGALANRDGTLTISNSTFFANIAYGPSVFGASGVGGGISNDGDGVVSISNSTVTANYSGARGGGLYNQGRAVTVKSTIVADNRGSMVTGNPDVFGTFLSQGFNLIGKKEGSTGFTASTDKKGTIAAPLNPKFDVKGLRNNGGPTLTIALTLNSPAVDKGTSLGLTGILSTDQRGSGFLRKVDKATANATGGDGTDIGAYELQ